jgi:hypothetical protein
MQITHEKNARFALVKQGPSQLKSNAAFSLTVFEPLFPELFAQGVERVYCYPLASVNEEIREFDVLKRV